MDVSMVSCRHCQSPIDEGAAYCIGCGAPVPGVAECEDYEYEAFISYRHLPRDIEVAKRIQHFIEGYKVPKDLANGRAGQKMGLLFRDEDELPTSASLSDQIDRALRRSRFLIVVCTPDTLKSRWVDQEIRQFAALHGRDRILLALAEGEPDDSFPRVLLTRATVGPDGGVEDVPAEPLAADFRDKRAYRKEALRLVAAMVGCGYDDLRQRQHARRNRAIALAASGVAAVSLVFGGISAYQQGRIAESYRQIQISQSEFLAKESGELLAQGDRYQAVQVAMAALPGEGAGGERPFVPAAQLALENALQVYPSPDRWRSCYSQTDIASYDAEFSDTGLMASIGADRHVEVAEIATGLPVCTIDADALLDIPRNDGADAGESVAFVGDTLIYRGDRGMHGCFDARTGELVWKLSREDASKGDDIVLSDDETLMAVVSRSYDFSALQLAVDVVDTRNGEVRTSLELPDASELGMSASVLGFPRAAFSPDNSSLAVASNGVLVLIDLESGACSHVKLKYDTAYSVGFAEGRIVAVTGENAIEIDGGNAALEVFDLALKPQWSRVEAVPSKYTRHGVKFSSEVKVCGTWRYDAASNDTQFVTMFGSDLLLLDAKTGKEVLDIPADTPYAACATAAYVDGSASLFACTCGGKLFWRSPDAVEGLVAGSSVDMEIGEVGQCEFVASGGRLYLSADPVGEPRRVMYRYCGFDDAVGAEEIESSLAGASFTQVGGYLFGSTDDALVMWDDANLAELARWSYADLEGLDEKADRTQMDWAVVPDEHRCFVVGPAAEREGQTGRRVMLYGFDLETRELLFASSVVDEVDTSFTMDECLEAQTDDDGRTVLLLKGSDGVAALDPDDGCREIWSVNRESSKYVHDCWKAGDRIVLYMDYGEEVLQSQKRFELVDIATGEAIPCDLSRYQPRNFTAKGHVSLSDHGDSLALVCNDGFTRLFDAHAGSLLWETDQVPRYVDFVGFMADGNLLIQGGDGNLISVSSADGSVRHTSSSTLGHVLTSWRPGEDATYVRYEHSGFGVHRGIAVIPDDAESLDPATVVYGGFVVFNGGRSIALLDTSDYKLYSMPLYKLDELMAQAREVVVGHELTDAERHLYQIE